MSKAIKPKFVSEIHRTYRKCLLDGTHSLVLDCPVLGFEVANDRSVMRRIPDFM